MFKATNVANNVDRDKLKATMKIARTKPNTYNNTKHT